MNQTFLSEEDIFQAARRIVSSDARAAYLAEACGSNLALRDRVVRLLATFREARSFLETPPSAIAVDSSGHTINNPLPERAGTQIGPYKLLQLIGEGGMGVVYMAEQIEPVERRVAVKIIKPGMDSRQVIARFEAERQALALMDHPNIAKVLDAGTTTGGLPYFVMELVKGIPITKYCDEQHLSLRERLELFVPVCQAVQHAHQKGIIHRDLKPTNLLVAEYDQQAVPKIIDFGLAKATGQKLTEKTMFTEFGQVVGTMEYMSPEQAKFNQLDIDTRTDVYSLGVLLYELLAGSTPFDSRRLRLAAFDEMLRIIREEEPLKPSTRLSSSDTLPSIAANRHSEPARLSKLVRGELDWIVMKCLEKDRSRRYETANGLAADVQRYLNDEPVQACPPSTWYCFRKFARRNKAALATVIAAALAVALAVVGLATSLLLIAREQKVTKNALQSATGAKNKMESALASEVRTVEKGRREAYFQSITLANHELSVDNLGRARKHLDECPPDLQKWEWRYLRRLCQFEPLVIRDTTEVNSVAFSPTGDHLVSGNINGEIKIWDSHTGRELKSFSAHPNPVVCVVFHEDGKHLATVGLVRQGDNGLDRQVKVWDLTTFEAVFNERCDAKHRLGAAHTVAFEPGLNSRRLAVGCGGVVQVWDWTTSTIENSLAGHEPRSISVAFARDGRLATGDWRGIVKLWDANSAGGSEPLRTFTKNPEVRHPACGLAFNHDGSRLASASFNRRVDVWDTATGEHIHTLRNTDGLVICVAFSPDGERIVSSGEGKIVHVWDAATGREVLGLRGHAGQCGCVTFSPDGQRLASASLDGTIRVWDATPLVGNEAQETLTFTGHENEIWSLAISPDGKRVASAGFSTPAKVWDLPTGHVSAPDFAGHGDISFRVAWHPDGTRLASAGSLAGKFTAKVWDARTGRELFPLQAEATGQEFVTLAFSPQGGKFLVTGRTDGTVQVWDAQSGKLFNTLIHGDMVRGVVFSADGQQLASLSSDGVVKLWAWDPTRAAVKNWTPEVRQLPIRAWVPGPGSPIAFSPDGRVGIGSEGYTAKIWDVQADRELQTLRGHSDDVYAVAFSPDSGGRWVATAGADSTVKVWDSHAGGPPVRSFRGHTGLVTCLAFTPDGQRLVSGSRDHTVKVWDVTPLNALPDR